MGACSSLAACGVASYWWCKNSLRVSNACNLPVSSLHSTSITKVHSYQVMKPASIVCGFSSSSTLAGSLDWARMFAG